MIIFSSFRAIAVLGLGLVVWALLAQISPHTAWAGIALFFVGAGLLAVGRMMSRPFRVETVAGVGYARRSHSVFFIPVWVWGILAMIAGLPLAVHPI